MTTKFINLNYNVKEYKDRYKALLIEIFDYIKKIAPEWSEKHLFVDGEFDSNQTKFEKMSNNLKIGVEAKSKEEGFILLLFLRMVVDRNIYHIANLMDYTYNDLEKIPLKDFYQTLVDSENEYTSIFGPNDIPSVTLHWASGDFTLEKEVITRQRSEIDIWDLERVKERLLNMI